MSEKLSPQSSVSTNKSRLIGYSRLLLASVGILLALYGASDIASRIKRYSLPSSVVVVAAPATKTVAYAENAEPITPAHLLLPSIGVSAEVEEVGKKTNGAMATPKTFDSVGWYKFGARPGEAGNAVFAGHVNNALTRAGVFEHLIDLKVQDTVAVSDASGQTLLFAVSEVDDYSNDIAPLARIFSQEGPAGLVLITCAGDWDPKAHSYNKRLVVYARLLVQ